MPFSLTAGWWRGCLALLPYAVVVVGWQAIRSAWGYGVWNMGVYVDPLTDPGRFAAAVGPAWLGIRSMIAFPFYPQPISFQTAPAGYTIFRRA